MKKVKKIDDLIRVYEDLERTLIDIKSLACQGTSLKHINVKKLVKQLSKSKKKVEQKIGNLIVSEKEVLQKKIHKLTSQFLKQ